MKNIQLRRKKKKKKDKSKKKEKRKQNNYPFFRWKTDKRRGIFSVQRQLFKCALNEKKNKELEKKKIEETRREKKAEVCKES